jgi:Phosphotransferase enzyme family
LTSSETAVRIGNAVRRAPGRHAALVRSLLQHFERVGFDGAPRFLGVDEQGREILSWVEGEAGGLPAPAADEVLAEVGRLMRRMHDAQAGVDVPGAEVVCHNDWWAGNIVFRDGEPAALIDWGLAAPAPRLQDVARCAAWWAPLRPDDVVRARGFDPARRGERLRVLCDGYGLGEEQRSRVLDAAVQAQLEWAEDPPGPAEAEAMRASAAWIVAHRYELEPWLR